MGYKMQHNYPILISVLTHIPLFMKHVLLTVVLQCVISLIALAQEPVEYGPIQIFGFNEGAAVIYAGNGWQQVTRLSYDRLEAMFDQPVKAGWTREYYIGISKGDNFQACGGVDFRFYLPWDKVAGHQFNINNEWGAPIDSRYRWSRVPKVSDQLAAANPATGNGYWQIECKVAAGCTAARYPKPTFAVHIYGICVKAVDKPASSPIAVVLSTEPPATEAPRFVMGGIAAPISIDEKSSNVGIGTMFPKAKLSVNGDIFAKRVKVTQNAADWPDYVFHPDYKLPSLDSTAAFISNNRHLPGMPSAQQIGENGLDLAEMNRLLLQKVEELTLHMIRSQEENKALKARVEQLEKRLISPEKQKNGKR